MLGIVDFGIVREKCSYKKSPPFWRSALSKTERGKICSQSITISQIASTQYFSSSSFRHNNPSVDTNVSECHSFAWESCHLASRWWEYYPLDSSPLVFWPSSKVSNVFIGGASILHLITVYLLHWQKKILEMSMRRTACPRPRDWKSK